MNILLFDGEFADIATPTFDDIEVALIINGYVVRIIEGNLQVYAHDFFR